MGRIRLAQNGSFTAGFAADPLCPCLLRGGMLVVVLPVVGLLTTAAPIVFSILSGDRYWSALAACGAYLAALTQQSWRRSREASERSSFWILIGEALVGLAAYGVLHNPNGAVACGLMGFSSFLFRQPRRL
jgi:hypothetical protein